VKFAHTTGASDRAKQPARWLMTLVAPALGLQIGKHF
jgi:hypothetical protein